MTEVGAVPHLGCKAKQSTNAHTNNTRQTKEITIPLRRRKRNKQNENVENVFEAYAT
jgi:hypothetical protein